MFCPSCGAARTGPVCQQCGAGSVTPSRATSATPMLLAAILGVLVLLVVVGAVIIVVGVPAGRTSGTTSESREAAPAPSATSAATAAAATTPAPTPTTTPASGPGDVRTLAPGLFCRDLFARGYSYTAAIDYWRIHGQPDQMDAERNGIPCETVYPASDVASYWGPRPQADYVYTSAFDDLPSGLFCRDLQGDGLSYADAVTYWNYWGRPDQMDADRDGIPCATVYSAADVDAYWY